MFNLGFLTLLLKVHLCKDVHGLSKTKLEEDKQEPKKDTLCKLKFFCLIFLTTPNSIDRVAVKISIRC